MPKYKTLDEVYNSCLADGEIRESSEINIQKIKDLMSNAETNICAANLLIKFLEKSNKEWMNVYIDYYEALRIYTEVLLSIAKLKISKHQCLFSCLCIKHPSLELDWDFFERIRTKRNGANYYGEQITYNDWRSIELLIKLYISALKEEINKKIAEL